MRGAAVAGLLVVAILVGAVAGYLIGSTNQQTVTSWRTLNSTSVSTTTNFVVFETTVPSLELMDWLVPHLVASGQNVTVVAEVYNPTAAKVTVSTPSFDNPAYGPCGQDFATGVNVYVGYYTFANLSNAMPLLLYGPAAYLCPPVSDFNYTFEPNSLNATIQPSLSGVDGKAYTKLVNETSVLAGYWSEGNNSTFSHFGVGQYSVVVSDAWGQQDILYFTVNP